MQKNNEPQADWSAQRYGEFFDKIIDGKIKKLNELEKENFEMDFQRREARFLAAIKSNQARGVTMLDTVRDFLQSFKDIRFASGMLAGVAASVAGFILAVAFVFIPDADQDVGSGRILAHDKEAQRAARSPPTVVVFSITSKNPVEDARADLSELMDAEIAIAKASFDPKADSAEITFVSAKRLKYFFETRRLPSTAALDDPLTLTTIAYKKN